MSLSTMLNKKPSIHLRHLLDIPSLNRQQITQLLDRGQYWLAQQQDNHPIPSILKDKVIINLFFEPSTRTLYSFEIAAKKLGAVVISPQMNNLSLLKGETLFDTIHTFESMGANAFVIRHQNNHTPHIIASEVYNKTAIVNAGDGYNQHPTQCLTDLLTIRQHFPDFSALTITIIGDISHSRVAESLIPGLEIMGTKDIRLVSPEALQPSEDHFSHLPRFTQLKDALPGSDVILTLRIQKERMQASEIPKEKQYFKSFGLTEQHLRLTKKPTIIMHPGPINRGIEIESSVADGSQSVILQQVQNGVVVRMAVLEALLSAPR